MTSDQVTEPDPIITAAAVALHAAYCPARAMNCTDTPAPGDQWHARATVAVQAAQRAATTELERLKRRVAELEADLARRQLATAETPYA